MKRISGHWGKVRMVWLMPFSWVGACGGGVWRVDGGVEEVRTCGGVVWMVGDWGWEVDGVGIWGVGLKGERRLMKVEVLQRTITVFFSLLSMSLEAWAAKPIMLLKYVRVLSAGRLEEGVVMARG